MHKSMLELCIKTLNGLKSLLTNEKTNIEKNILR